MMKNTWKVKVQSEDGQTKEVEVNAGWSPEKIKADEIAIVGCIQENVRTGHKHQPLGSAVLQENVKAKRQAGPLSLVPA
jgi:hypothetical protein